MDKINKKKLIEYLESAKRTGEHNYLIELFAKLENHKEFSEFLVSDWNSFFDENKESGKDLSELLKRIHYEIELIEEEQKESWKKRFLSTYSKIAAVLLLPILIAGVYYLISKYQSSGLNPNDRIVEVYAPENSRVKYILPDASVVWINSGSSIKYNSTFIKKRVVELDGKAYFEVTHQSNNPFSIAFNNGAIEVLGTKFSISANDNGDFNVVLVEGKVKALLGHEKLPVLLAPNQRLEVSGNKYRVESVNAKNIVAWKDGLLIFRNTTLKEVVKRLSDWYGINVELKDKRLESLTYRGIFKDEDVDEVLKLMGMTLPIKSKIIPRIKLKNDTYEKERVIIYKN